MVTKAGVQKLQRDMRSELDATQYAVLACAVRLLIVAVLVAMGSWN